MSSQRSLPSPPQFVVDIGLDTRKNKATKSNAGREIWQHADGEMKKHGLEVTTRMKAEIPERPTECLAIP